jgi:hypothetical protein
MNHLVPAAVYFLCMATSALCALLLVRAWLKTRTPLLLWTAACFVLLAINNVLLVIDMIILPRMDLSPARTFFALAAVGVLLFGFIRET